MSREDPVAHQHCFLGIPEGEQSPIFVLEAPRAGSKEDTSSGMAVAKGVTLLTN
jgi:hypothetical protein